MKYKAGLPTYSSDINPSISAAEVDDSILPMLSSSVSIVFSSFSQITLACIVILTITSRIFLKNQKRLLLFFSTPLHHHPFPFTTLKQPRIKLFIPVFSSIWILLSLPTQTSSIFQCCFTWSIAWIQPNTQQKRWRSEKVVAVEELQWVLGLMMSSIVI